MPTENTVGEQIHLLVIRSWN